MKLVIVEIGGSSPLARGPLVRRRRQLRGCGLIPARAGTTWRAAGSGPWHGAHPRSRGDHPRACGFSAGGRGSSPLARGPHTRAFRLGVRLGLIPARAGTTTPPKPRSCARRAHPRSRGDHSNAPQNASQNRGSSPLARGPPCLDAFHNYAAGLIPARAGTTAPRSRTSTITRAHPRSRGDHPETHKPRKNNQGSSPLARGPPEETFTSMRWPGLIPARAGTTLTQQGGRKI